ncbi:AAA family ATPase [Nonomuraea turkmeniaca]|uniref:AAA family ATPase n=1 Tax=Nonomuraea turkmeniaca TaxID=103838 RepID=UPI00319D9B13
MEFLEAFRVVIINGPRQSGKTTLLRQLEAYRGGTYLTLVAAGLGNQAIARRLHLSDHTSADPGKAR